MMGRAGRPQFDDQGVAVIYVHDVKKHFYKKFLYEPFPVESRWHERATTRVYLNISFLLKAIPSKIFHTATIYVVVTWLNREIA